MILNIMNNALMSEEAKYNVSYARVMYGLTLLKPLVDKSIKEYNKEVDKNIIILADFGAKYLNSMILQSESVTTEDVVKFTEDCDLAIQASKEIYEEIEKGKTIPEVWNLSWDAYCLLNMLVNHHHIILNLKINAKVLYDL